MFTGIVQHLGRIAAFEPDTFGATLQVDSCDWRHKPAFGDSIAVNGCCLTVACDRKSDRNMLRFDVIRQTLEVTTLGSLRPGDAVNLEHAVTPQTLLGGHIVQGHVDGVGTINRVERTDSEHRLRIEPNEPATMECIIDRGSIAVSGVSLTVAAVGQNWFEVALIPTTLQQTNLGDLKPGDLVNLETDYLAKVVVNHLHRTKR